MDELVITRKLKVARNLSKYSLATICGWTAFYIYALFVYLLLRIPITAAEFSVLLFLPVYIIGFGILLKSEGKYRKKTIGIYFLIFALILIAAFIKLIVDAFGGAHVFDLRQSLNQISLLLSSVLGIMLFLLTFGKIKSSAPAKYTSLFVFVASVVLDAVIYGFFCITNDLYQNMVSIFGAATMLVPQILWTYIPVQAFDSEFFSRFIEENPIFFIPNKYIGGDTVRAILMYGLGAVIAILLIIMHG